MFDELLSTVFSKPYGRALFQHLIAAIGRLIPHDEAQLVLLTEDGSPYLYVRTPDGESEGVAGKSAATHLESFEPQVLDTVPEPDRDLRCGLKVPVKVRDRLIGAFALYSRGPGGYSPSDLAVAQRAATYLALGLDYQRLVEQARDAANERQRSCEIESSVELLRTISDVLDIRTVFARVSEIAKKMLPHDALAMVFTDRDRHFVHQAKSPSDFPDPPFVRSTTPMPDDQIIGDVTTDALPVRAGPAGVSLEQDAGRQASRPHANSALSTAAKIRT